MNRSIPFGAIAAALALGACSAPAPTVRDPGGDIDNVSTTPVVRLERDGRTTAVRGTIPTGESDPGRAADVFLDQHGDAIGVDDPTDSLQQRETQTHPSENGDDETTVVYDGQQDGHRVYGSEVRVIVREGEVVYAGGNTTTDDSELGEAVFDADSAFAMFDGTTPETWEREGQELVAFNLGILIHRPTRSVLAWMLDVRTGFHPWRTFVDAQTGQEIIRLPRFAHARSSETYSFDGVVGFDHDDAVLTHRDGMGVEGVMPSAGAVAADGYVGTIYNYFNDVHGRDSFDGSGATIKTYVDMVGYENASWDGEILEFDPEFLSLDVMGHEFTHAVVTHTAGLEYAFESGALNESYADILGEFAAGETTWTIGESTPYGTLRSFSSPDAYGQPAHYRNRFGYGTFDDCSGANRCGSGETCVTDVCLNEEYDHGGVHYNSGITNHAIYLLTDGGTSDDSGIEVQAIGRTKVEHLVYRALATALGGTSDFEDFRFGLRTTALSFIENGEHEFTYQDCGSVLNAMAAVGIGEPDQDNDCFDDEVDNCPCLYNPEQNDDDCDGAEECPPQCDLNRTCDQCGADDACGWCGGSCRALDQESTCPGEGFEECEDDSCSGATCAECAIDGECSWCDGFCESNATECIGQDGRTVPFIHTDLCIYVDCPAEDSCGDCTGSSCTWCDGQCVAEASECTQDAPATCDPVDCSGGTDCSTCTAIAGCAWGEMGCVEAGTAGASTDVSLCACGDQSTCDECTHLGCAWAGDSCSAEATAGATTDPSMCEPMADPCRDAMDCSACAETAGCGWAGMGCITAMPGTPGIVTRSAECFDCTGLTDCTSCATNGFCEWCPGSGCHNTYEDACAMPTPVLECS